MSQDSACVCVAPGVDVTDYITSMESVPISFTPYITNKTTHYVTTQLEFDKKTTRVVNAQRKNIFIVVESFLRDCVTSQSVVDAKPYLISPPVSVTHLQVDSINITNWNPEELAAKQVLDPNRKREIKIFISSTFRDMGDERSLLVSKIFPQLNAICQQRNVAFSFVDLRWGITESNAKNDKAIQKCLEHVDQCRPYFISFLGERYGWSQNDGFSFDEKLSDSFRKAAQKFPWVNKYKDRSVSELEIIYGALHPELSPVHQTRSDKSSRSFFFFRDPLSITKRFELGDPERKNYEEESSDAHRKLRELKETIRASALPLVDGYSLENLSTLLIDCLVSSIDLDFPADEAAAQTNSLIISSAEISAYYRSDFVHKALQSFADMSFKPNSSFQPPFIVAGGEGSGKTTSLLHWLQERLETGSKDSEFIVSYTIAEDNLSPYQISKELLTRLAELKIFNFSSFCLPHTQNNDEIRIFLFGVFEAIDFHLKQQGKRIILALPGSHHFSLAWLPELFPSSFRVLLTAREIPPGDKKLKNYCLVPAWRSSEKEIFIKQYLKIYSKKLESRFMHLLLQSNATANPLYLKIVLDQLVHMGSFDNLSLSVSRYLSCKTIQELFKCIFEDWEKTFHKSSSSPFVANVLGYLSLAHSGITENELLELSGASENEWNSFFYTLKYFTISSSRGLLFYHNSLKEAVASHYFAGTNLREELLSKLARYFETIPLSQSVHEMPFILLKLSSTSDSSRLQNFMRNSENISFVHEALSYEEIHNLWDGIEDFCISSGDIIAGKCTPNAVLTILQISENFCSTLHIADMVRRLICVPCFQSSEYSYIFALYLEKNGNYQEASELLTPLLVRSPSLEVLSLLGVINKKQGLYDEATNLYNRCIQQISSNSGQIDSCALAEFKLLLADIERKQENYENALSFYHEAYSDLKTVLGDKHEKLINIFKNIGLVHKKRFQYEQAKRQYAKALHLLEIKGQEKSKRCGFIMTEMADVYRKTSEYETARGCYESALSIIEASCGVSHPEVAEVLNSFGILLKKQGKYSEALPLYQRSLKIIENTFTKEHYKYAVCLNNIGDLQRKTGDFDAAIVSYSLAQEIFGVTLGESHSEYAEVSNNIGLVYKKQGKYPQARKEYEKAIRIIFNAEVRYSAVNIKIGLFLVNLADVFRKEGNYQKALNVYDQAQEIIIRCLGSEDVEVADVRQNRALVFIDQQEFNAAREELNIGSRIVLQSLGKNHPKMGYCLHKQGMLAAATGDVVGAITLLKKSLKILYAALDKYHPEVADVLITLGEVQSKFEVQNALQSFSSALEIIFFCFGKDHYKYISVSESIQSLGGKIPVFQRPVVTKKGNMSWRKALNNLIAKNSVAQTEESSNSSRNPNAQLIFMAMASGLI